MPQLVRWATCGGLARPETVCDDLSRDGARVRRVAKRAVWGHLGGAMARLPLTSAIAAYLPPPSLSDVVERACARCGARAEVCDGCQAGFAIGDGVRCADGAHTCRRCASAGRLPAVASSPLDTGRVRRIVIRHRGGKVAAHILPIDGIVLPTAPAEVPPPPGAEVERDGFEIDGEPIA